jgi:hypothetical protein
MLDNMFRWDPCGFMRCSYGTHIRWDHTFWFVGPTISIVRFMIKNLCFPLCKRKRPSLNYVFLISFLNYIVQYFSLDFVQLQTTSQIILFNIFHRICVLTFLKNSALKIIYLHKLYIIFYKVFIYFIYIKLWCKSLWLAQYSVCISLWLPQTLLCMWTYVHTFYLWILSLTFIWKRTKIWLDHLIRVYIGNFHEFWWIYEFAGTI